jgi:hypothetical protein
MILSLPDVALGAIGASIVAATISLVGLTVTKEQKISELRQAWIDSLRSELSELIAHAHGIHGASSAQFTTRIELWKAVKENFEGINRVSASIELRLNPAEATSQTILACVKELEVLIASDAPINFVAMQAIERRLVSASQSFLKDEWKRVKRGEPTYRFAKLLSWVGLAALIGTLLLVGVMNPAPLDGGKVAAHPATDQTQSHEQNK